MSTSIVSLVTGVVTLVSVLLGQWFTRKKVDEHLQSQDGHIADVHVLVNQRLTDALRVGQLLAAQLTNAGIEPVIAPPVQPTPLESASLAAALAIHDSLAAAATAATAAAEVEPPPEENK